MGSLKNMSIKFVKMACHLCGRALLNCPSQTHFELEARYMAVYTSSCGLTYNFLSVTQERKGNKRFLTSY